MNNMKLLDVVMMMLLLLYQGSSHAQQQDGGEQDVDQCAASEFACVDELLCVDSVGVCDGEQDCDDNSDETLLCYTVPVLEEFLLVLDSSRRNIFQVNLQDRRVMPLLPWGLHKPVAVAIDAWRLVMYWVDDVRQSTGGAQFIIRQRNLADSTQSSTDILQLTGAMTSVASVAVDPLSQRLFYSVELVDSVGRSVGRLESVSESGADKRVLLEAVGMKPTAIALDTVNRWIYWTDRGPRASVSRANMDDIVFNKHTLVSTDVAQPSGLTLDIAAGLMYWSDVTQCSIEVASVDGSSRRVVTRYSGDKYTSLSAGSDALYVTDSTRRAVRRLHAQRSTVSLSDATHAVFGRPTAVVYTRQRAEGTNTSTTTSSVIPAVPARDVTTSRRHNTATTTTSTTTTSHVTSTSIPATTTTTTISTTGTTSLPDDQSVLAVVSHVTSALAVSADVSAGDKWLLAVVVVVVVGVVVVVAIIMCGVVVMRRHRSVMVSPHCDKMLYYNKTATDDNTYNNNDRVAMSAVYNDYEYMNDVISGCDYYLAPVEAGPAAEELYADGEAVSEAASGYYSSCRQDDDVQYEAISCCNPPSVDYQALQH